MTELETFKLACTIQYNLGSILKTEKVFIILIGDSETKIFQ